MICPCSLRARTARSLAIEFPGHSDKFFHSRAAVVPRFEFRYPLITALGVGLWLSALNVLYRDVGYILPVLTQLLLFISPVGYSTSTVSLKWQALYALNPVVGVVESFRWVMLGTVPSDSLSLGILVAISSAVAVFLLVTGLCYFRRMERTFADMV